MISASILYGVCGIGMGHANRQTPVIEHLIARGARIMIFAYGESHKFYTNRFDGNDSVRVERVSVPFYVGNAAGLDFAATAKLAANNGENHLEINSLALAAAQSWLGNVDLVVSDYEPVCASYAYAHGAPLVTIDQQSKYLVGDFPETLAGEGFKDEVARLRMFFPRADSRIACSFFTVNKNKDCTEKVDIVAPILKDEILSVAKDRAAFPDQAVLVYFSSQRDFVQSVDEVAKICSAKSNWKFDIFVPASVKIPSASSNVQFHTHGDSTFRGCLKRCAAIITTAGHTLLSEAMHLNIPVFAIPLAVYEQQMNAHVIEQYGFGMSREKLTGQDLERFLTGIPEFTRAIRADTKILMRGTGQQQIIAALESMMPLEG